MAKLNLSNIGPMDNYIMNGDFTIWQRGDDFSFTAHPDSGFTADRWEVESNGLMEYDIDISGDVPTFAQSGHLSAGSIKVDITTIDGSIGSTDYFYLNQRIEGYNFKPLVGKQAVLSFWVKSTKTGLFSIGLRNYGTDRCLIKEYTVNTTDTWEKKVIPITFNYSGGTWNYTYVVGVEVIFSLAMGSGYTTAADVWTTGNKLAVTDHVNAADSASNNFFLSQVKLEQGTIATPFVGRDHATEWNMCERYYEKSYDWWIDPGTITYTGALIDMATRKIAGYSKGCEWRTPKRFTPTITLYSPGTGTSGYVENNGDKVAAAASPGVGGFYLMTVTSGDAASNLTWHYTAVSEL